MGWKQGKQQGFSLKFVSRAFLFLLLGAIILTSFYIFNQINLSRCFPIKTVRVYGTTHTDQSEVQTVLMPIVRGGYFGVSVETIKEKLLQMPWVADIFVHRIWPDQVEISVIEKNAVARWNNQSLLSEGGELFIPSNFPDQKALPDFVGGSGQQITLLRYFNEINRIFLPLHAKISYLELTPLATWKMRLDNGISLQIGNKDILTRLNHFVKVYPKIVGDRVADVDYVDLRYPNGMAVRWKEKV